MRNKYLKGAIQAGLELAERSVGWHESHLVVGPTGELIVVHGEYDNHYTEDDPYRIRLLSVGGSGEEATWSPPDPEQIVREIRKNFWRIPEGFFQEFIPSGH